MKKACLIIFAVTLCAIFSCKKEQSQTQKNSYGNFKGVVYNEFNQPIDGAKIIIGDQGNMDASTLADGSFRFSSIPVKQYQVTISKDTYISQTITANIIADKTDSVRIVLKSGKAYVKTSQDSVIAKSSAGDVSLAIQSNTSWVASKSAGFITISPNNGSGNGVLNVHYLENTGLAPRTDTISITAGDQKVKVIFRQTAALKLVSYYNGTSLIDDSLFAIFNKPVKVVSIQTDVFTCLSDNMGYRLINQSTGVKFRYTCSTILGRTFPFTITVQDNDGNTLAQKIDFNSFTTRRDLKGIIMNYFFSQDNKSIWVATQNPNMIYELSTADFSILRQFSLGFAPTKASLNVYNNLLYILTNSEYIYVVSSVTGQQIKQISVTARLGGGSNPAIAVYDIGFTNSGYGIIIYPIASTTNGWQIIDSKHNDKLYLSPEYVEGSGDFMDIHNSFDNSKLFLTQLYGSCLLTVFDGNTQTFQKITPTSQTRDMFITPNKKNDKIYFGQLYDQFIMDLNKNTSKISGLDNRANGSADFCYLAGKENHIYFASDDFFAVLNYDNQQSLMTLQSSGMRGCMTSVDGKYLILYNGSVVYQFSTSMFNN